MGKVEFLEGMSRIVEVCLPDEFLVFDMSGPRMVDELWATGTLTERRASGVVEIVDVHTAKTVLECVPLLCACYKLAREAKGMFLRNRAQHPSHGELFDLLVRYGAPPPVAQNVVKKCREALEQLTI